MESSPVGKPPADGRRGRGDRGKAGTAGQGGGGAPAAVEASADWPMPDVTDPQTRAYRDMTAADAVLDDALFSYAVRSHPPLAGPPGEHLVGREDYDAEGWDQGREDPR